MNKLVKLLVWIAGIILVILVLGFIAVQLFFPVEKAKALAIEKGSDALGRPITINDVKLSFWGGLGVKLVDVSVGNPAGFNGEPFFKSDNIDVKLQLLPLLTKQVKIDRFIINNPSITMTKLEDGSNNFSFSKVDSSLPEEAKQLPAETKTAAAAISFEKLEVHGGKVIYRNDSSKLFVQMDNLELSSALKNPNPGIYISSGKLSIDSLRIEASQPVPVVHTELVYDATYDLNTKHISFEKANFIINGVELNLNGNFFHETGQQKGNASLKAEHISIENILTFVPPKRAEMINKFRVSGDLAVDLDVDFNAGRTPNPLVYSGSAVVTDLNLSRREQMGELKLKRIIVDVKPDNVRANIQEGTFDGKPVKANILVSDFKDPLVNGELSGYLNFVFLKPFLPVNSKQELDGEARFDLKFLGKIKEPRAMDISGDISIDKGSYNASFLPEPIDVFTFDASFDKSVVNVRKLTGKSQSADIIFIGRLDNLIPYIMADSIAAKEIHPGVDGTLTGKVDLGLVQRYLPAARKPQLTGSANLNLTVSGSTGDLANLRPKGQITLENVTYSDSLIPEPIRRFDAELQLTPDTIAVKRMNIKFVTSDASFFGTLVKPFPYLLPLKTIDRTNMAKPFFSFKLASNRFDCDKLFPEATPGSGDITKKPLDSLSTIILPDINGQGTFDFDTLIYDKIEFTKIKGKAKIYDRKIEAYDVTGKAYTGSVTGKTTVDLSDFNNPKYSGAFQANQIEADDFVTRFTPFGGHLFGKLDFSGSFDAVGWEPDQFLQSMTLDGNGVVQEGKFVTSGIMYDAIKGLADKVGQEFDKEQPLRALKTIVKVRDGKLILEGMKSILGNIGDLELQGYYGFNGQIGYSGSLLLTKEMTQKLMSSGGLLGSLAGIASDRSSQRLKLPLSVSGTSANPKVELDFSGLSKNVKDNLKEQTKDAINNLLKKK